ncbi:autotransporter outer membrane beta-barrel domain-containing protein, partial [Campylobacter sp. 2018MI13]|nr:autotransporter outer membrane beta-barrel domain-containing protein [Campylobacter sp. 2018MI13]
LVFTSFANEVNSIAKDIEVTANVKLKNNSTLSIMNNSNFSGSIITEDDNSTLNLNNANIDANINVANLNASKTNFMFSLNNTLISSISTLGGQNTFMIKPDLANANKFLLASLVNTNNTINNDYLKALDYKENISIYTPNVEFVNENGKANWYLVKVNKEDIENTTPIVPETKPEPTKPNDDLNKPSVKDYFFVQENKEVTQMIDSSLNQVFFSYVLEWNNLQKRMGELRNNTDANAGIWFRAYTGQSSYEHANKTKFYEMQLGADKLNQGNNYVNYTGLIFNASKYSLSDNLDGSIKGYGFGAYSSTIYDNGLYFDVIAKYINYKNDFNLYVKNQNEVTNSLKPNNSYTFLASAEIGYRKDFNNF